MIHGYFVQFIYAESLYSQFLRDKEFKKNERNRKWHTYAMLVPHFVYSFTEEHDQKNLAYSVLYPVSQNKVISIFIMCAGKKLFSFVPCTIGGTPKLSGLPVDSSKGPFSHTFASLC